MSLTTPSTLPAKIGPIIVGRLDAFVIGQIRHSTLNLNPSLELRSCADHAETHLTCQGGYVFLSLVCLAKIGHAKRFSWVLSVLRILVEIKNEGRLTGQGQRKKRDKGGECIPFIAPSLAALYVGWQRSSKLGFDRSKLSLQYQKLLVTGIGLSPACISKFAYDLTRMIFIGHQQAYLCRRCIPWNLPGIPRTRQTLHGHYSCHSLIRPSCWAVIAGGVRKVFDA